MTVRTVANDTDALPHAALGNLIAFQDNATRDHCREAIPHLQEAFVLDPRLAPAHQALGVSLLSLGRVQAAIEALETADRLAGNGRHETLPTW
ncbi:hypothetical protein [Enhygromyxa salina]|uniref:hypothetical protein n=1 Tax=Enhygromyxa salina TaxID=215803 RepID=UPI0011BAA2EE|nr:hypothetical protein [Enhygromyxa salina]